MEWRHLNQFLQRKQVTGIVLYMYPANGRQHDIVMSSFIGWAHIKIFPEVIDGISYVLLINDAGYHGNKTPLIDLSQS